MINKISCGAVVLALIGGFGQARGISPEQTPPAELHYQASCSVVDFNSVDGYVSNLSADTYRVRGEARFKFRFKGSMSRPQILVPTDSLIQPGETARVSRARLAFVLRPGETCRFDVKSVIRQE